ncbi:MAG: HAMP domain-containing sensor histidine kinase [Campylobacterales bacterium]|nr:HAMP domain-containing sensor histidine kinase [Campylobacterales bacterium]
MRRKKGLGKSALQMTLGIVSVIVLFAGYTAYSEISHLSSYSIETFFRLFILAVVVVISVGFFWGFFVSRVTRELSVLTEFLKNHEAGRGRLDESGFSIEEFSDIAANINDMLKEINEKNRELKELNENLEQNVEIKTKVLEKKNEELSSAKKQVEKALSSRDKFIKDSIHEINTPLAVIQANIELMRLSGQSNKYLVKMEAAAKIITNIYEDLSYFIKKDRFIIKKELINISEFLSERVEYFKEPAIGANVSILFDVPEQMFVSFDRTQLQRMFDNNIFNAIKYSKEGGEIKISLFADKNGKIIFEVINSALYKPDVNNIFKRFYRGSDSRGGFGIGLSLVYQIAVQNGVGICCAVLEDGTVWFAYAFKDYFEDAFSSHGF